MSTIDVVSAASVEPQPINWLAPGRLARGHLHILDGDPCTGKSYIALDIARALSLGEVPFATGALPEGTPASSLLMMAEDSISDTLVPRLKAMGADLHRIHFYSQRDGQAWSVPAAALQIREAVERLRPVFLVLDPIVSFLSASVQLYHDASVRMALRPLAQMASDFGVAVLMSRHLNKAVRQRAMYRGSGSIAFTAAARVAFATCANPQNSRERLLVNVKNNLWAKVESLRYGLETDGAGSRLAWLGAANPLTEQLSLPEPGRRSKFDLAREFLLTLLGNGPLSAEKIWQEAQALDLSVRTVNAAKAALGIASKRLVAEGRVCSLWMLPGDVAKEPAGELIAEFGERFEGDPFETEDG